jgi:hypothetical protein
VIKERSGDRALRVCDKCGHEQWVNYWNVYRKDIHICRYCSITHTAKTRKGNPWNKGVKQAPRKVGNTFINNNGYVEVWIGKHTKEDKVGGYYREHKLLKELQIGRLLNDNDIIHHVDGNKTNNSVDNLVVCAGHYEHRKLHGQLERVTMELVRAGVIKFNHESNEYYIDPFARECISKSLELLGSPTANGEGNQQRSFEDMSPEERSTTIQKWSTLKRVEAGDNSEKS